MELADLKQLIELFSSSVKSCFETTYNHPPTTLVKDHVINNIFNNYHDLLRTKYKTLRDSLKEQKTKSAGNFAHLLTNLAMIMTFRNAFTTFERYYSDSKKYPAEKTQKRAIEFLENRSIARSTMSALQDDEMLSHLSGNDIYLLVDIPTIYSLFVKSLNIDLDKGLNKFALFTELQAANKTAATKKIFWNTIIPLDPIGDTLISTLETCLLKSTTIEELKNKIFYAILKEYTKRQVACYLLAPSTQDIILTFTPSSEPSGYPHSILDGLDKYILSESHRRELESRYKPIPPALTPTARSASSRDITNKQRRKSSPESAAQKKAAQERWVVPMSPGREEAIELPDVTPAGLASLPELAVSPELKKILGKKKTSQFIDAPLEQLPKANENLFDSPPRVAPPKPPLEGEIAALQLPPGPSPYEVTLAPPTCPPSSPEQSVTTEALTATIEPPPPPTLSDVATVKHMPKPPSTPKPKSNGNPPVKFKFKPHPPTYPNPKRDSRTANKETEKTAPKSPPPIIREAGLPISENDLFKQARDIFSAIQEQSATIDGDPATESEEEFTPESNSSEATAVSAPPPRPASAMAFKKSAVLPPALPAAPIRRAHSEPTPTTQTTTSKKKSPEEKRRHSIGSPGRETTEEKQTRRLATNWWETVQDKGSQSPSSSDEEEGVALSPIKVV